MEPSTVTAMTSARSAGSRQMIVTPSTAFPQALGCASPASSRAAFASWPASFTRSRPIKYDLIEKGATIRAHDPEAMHMAKTPDYFGDNPSIEYFDDKYKAIEGADAMLVVTEWKDFRTPDFDRIKAALKEPIIFDGRLLYEPKKMEKLGIEYHSIGR